MNRPDDQYPQVGLNRCDVARPQRLPFDGTGRGGLEACRFAQLTPQVGQVGRKKGRKVVGRRHPLRQRLGALFLQALS